MKKILNSNMAPKAIGPYSQGINLQSGLTFVSGQLPIDPLNQQIYEEPYIATMQSLKNIESILKEANQSKENIVKITVLMRDLKDFEEMNKAYSDFFGEWKPARSAFQVVRLPKDAVIEIEAISC